LGDFNTDCTHSSEPYCVSSSSGYVCAECMSSCDCGMNEYCSGNPETAGQCLKFGRNGKSCRNLSLLQLENITFDDSWKCAETYPMPNLPSQLIVDQSGVCIDGTCRYCDPRMSSSLSMTNCGPGSGMKGERTCVYPGMLVNTHAMTWSPGFYYEYPRFVWDAIIFCMIVLILGEGIAIEVIKIVRGRKKRPEYEEIKPVYKE